MNESVTTDLLVDVRGLTVEFPSPAGWIRVVNDLSFQVRRSEVLGIVGESGSGKSVTSLAITGLIDERGGRIASGSVVIDGRDVRALSKHDLRRWRGDRIGMIFQQPTRCLNPAYTVGEQIAETLRQNRALSRAEAWRRAVVLLEKVGIDNAAKRATDYPYMFSGGMCQRAMIAIAIACEPALLIADEPTTALDVTVQAKILELLRDLQHETKITIIQITHDLGVVAQFCDRMLVMHAGEPVEYGETSRLLAAPKHPYTSGLLGAALMRREMGHLVVVPGTTPRPGDLVPGCRFNQRCWHREPACLSGPPPAIDFEPSHYSRCRRARELALSGMDTG